ncbi:MAG: carbon storage regulator [Gammaproteobacteria bacterium]|nr:carbon storage regulator [Gammaproteobacteria bacterium]
MLIFTRRSGQSLNIGDDIAVTMRCLPLEAIVRPFE